MIRYATFSECGTFRYTLTCQWDGTKPDALFIMLNPSTADGMQDDPTIRKCWGFAVRLGFGSLSVVNLYAFRATDPRHLARHGWQVGPDNDAAIREMLDKERLHRGMGREVICAWGTHVRTPKTERRAAAVVEMARDAGYTPKVLAWGQDGTTPRHPLMLPYGPTLDAGLLPVPARWPWA